MDGADSMRRARRLPYRCSLPANERPLGRARNALNWTTSGSPASQSIGCPFAERPAVSRTATALLLLVLSGSLNMPATDR
jgi:hypothetical protein